MVRIAEHPSPRVGTSVGGGAALLARVTGSGYPPRRNFLGPYHNSLGPYHNLLTVVDTVNNRQQASTSSGMVLSRHHTTTFCAHATAFWHVDSCPHRWGQLSTFQKVVVWSSFAPHLCVPQRGGVPPAR